MARHDEQRWVAAWEAAYAKDEPEAPAPARPRRRRSPRTRSVMVATGLLVLGLTGIGVADNGDVLREGQRNGTATRETEIISRTNETGGAKGGYSTRQSNLSRSGGGAVYGCRAGTGNNTNPCLRVNNLEGGLAFELHASKGDLGGTFTVGNGGDAKKPFTTNATGVATGLNADEVDGQSANEIVAAARAKTGLDADTVDGAGAGDLRTRWALVNEAGQIEAQSGGFTVLDPYVTNQNVYIDAGESLENNGLTATIAIRNVEPPASSFAGEISVSRCQIPGVVECAPASSKTNRAFVVSPRNSDGTATGAGDRKRFYVTITE
jgi:hypothetical protein